MILKLMSTQSANAIESINYPIGCRTVKLYRLSPQSHLKIQYFITVAVKIPWSKQLKDQPVLLLSSFVHNSSINEHKKMKLREKLVMKGLIEINIIGVSEIICK